MSSKSWNSYFLKGPKLGSRIKTLNEAFLPKKSSKLSLKQALQIRSAEQLHWDWPSMLKDDYPIVPEPWDLSHCFVEQKLALSLRVLSKKPKASLLRYLYQQKLQNLYTQKPKVTLTDKKRLKDKITDEITSHTLPQVQHCQGLFDFDRQTLMILSGNKKMNKLFSIFFEKTFLSEKQFLTPKNPGGLAVHLDEDERLEEMLPWEMPLTFSDIKKRI